MPDNFLCKAAPAINSAKKTVFSAGQGTYFYGNEIIAPG